MNKRPTSETVQAARHATVRKDIRRILSEGPATARDLSKLVGMPEHDVPGHLEHVERSLKHTGESLVVEPPTCLDCAFVFTRRHRFTRPSHCPNCRGRRISLPQFQIKS
ncbi:MAG TPA: transcriptional regulator [Candidatus Binatia bacterium]|nr:transcriptional regulator [Candidatus Binatia bacterium]